LDEKEQTLNAGSAAAPLREKELRPVGSAGPHSVLKPPSIDDISKTSPVSERR
jgi:hypothetical protein